MFDFVFKPKVAFAYTMVLLIGASAFFYLNQPDEIINPADCKTLACLEKAELLRELKMTDLSDENLYELVDVDDLDEQLFGEEDLDGLLDNEMMDSL